MNNIAWASNRYSDDSSNKHLTLTTIPHLNPNYLTITTTPLLNSNTCALELLLLFSTVTVFLGLIDVMWALGYMA